MKQLLHKKQRAIFLDRDGVVNKKPPEHNYVKHWGEFEFTPNIDKVIRKLNKKFLVVLVSNQGGVSRGAMSLDDVNDIHHRMKLHLKKNNAVIDKIYFCPHYIQENCFCRKPKPGMLMQAAKDLNIELSQSYVVGDSITDIEAGKMAGCKTILLGEVDDVEKVKPDFIAHSILEISHFID